jgi:Tfp pilus tip-associated adhesin PilY1
VPADLALTAADMSLYPQPASHISITDPNKPTSLERLGDSIIDFARGADAFDEDGDGSRTNVRPFIFGDVFHSSPLAIGAPLNSMRFETNYGPASDPNSFMGRYLLRKRVLYVGANDGFLHAIDAGTFTDPNTSVAGDEYYTAGTGREIFGYVPSFVLGPEEHVAIRGGKDVADQARGGALTRAPGDAQDRRGTERKEQLDQAALITPAARGRRG